MNLSFKFASFLSVTPILTERKRMMHDENREMVVREKKILHEFYFPSPFKMMLRSSKNDIMEI